MRIQPRHALGAAAALAVLGTAFVGLIPGASAAIAASTLVNPISGKCLSVSSSTTGTQVKIQTCTSASGQKWTSTSASELRVTIGGTTRCLTASAAGTANGTKLVVAACNGTASQKFKLNSNRTITGTQSGKCADIYKNGTASGTIVQLWTC